MTRRSIAFAAVLATLLSIISLLLFDCPIAQFVHQLGGEHSKFLSISTTVLEVVSGMTLSKFALGLGLIVVGAALLTWKAKRYIGWLLLCVGCTHFTARLMAGVLKEVFHRLRPYEVLSSGVWDNQFFTAHGGAFPSGPCSSRSRCCFHSYAFRYSSSRLSLPSPG